MDIDPILEVRQNDQGQFAIFGVLVGDDVNA